MNLANLTLGEPRAGYLLALLPVMALVWWRSKVYMTRRSRLALFGLRALTVALLVLALADLRLPRHQRGSGQGVAVVVDVSDSVGRPAAEALVQQVAELWPSWRTTLGPGAHLELGLMGRSVLPAGDALPEGGGADLQALRAMIERTREGTGKQSTNIPEALSFARDSLPAADASRLVLISDGRSNRGELEEELLAARLRELAVYPLEVPSSAEDPLHVESLRAPEQVFTGDEYTVAARVSSQAAGHVRVTLRQNDTIIERRTMEVAVGVSTFSHKLTAGAPGSISLDVRVDPIDVPDLHPENNAFSAFTRVRQVPKVLFVTQDPSLDLALLAALQSANLDFETASFASLPDKAALLAQHSAVLLDSPASQDLTPAQQEALRRYVKEKGGGLLMIGGKNTLARGTWLRDTLETALPVHLVPSAESSPFALYLLLDSSSSMSGAPIAQVKFAARRIISLMAGRSLGVAHFNTDVYVAVPLQQVGDNKLLVATDIDRIRAAGGTSFAPGLKLAREELVRWGAAQNRIILLSDGQPSDEFLVRRYFDTLNRDGIKVSTVGIGTSVNTALLQEIAQRCNGRYYGVADLTRLVEIFEEEVERLIGPPYEEASFVPDVNRKHYLARNLPAAGLPELHGYLGTTLKKGAETVMVNGYGDPILAVWQYGLGKSAMWSSDVHGAWGRDWRHWKTGFTPFWEGVIKAIVRSELSDFKLALQLEGKRARVVVDAVDKEGRFLNGETLEAVVHPPEGGEVERLRLRQSEEGRYEGHFATERRGFYAVQLLRREAGVDNVVNQSGVALGYDPEYHPGGGGGLLLERIAGATGGRMLRDLEDVKLLLAEQPETRRSEETRFWPVFAFVGVLVFFLEVALRRLGRFHVRELGELETGQDQGYAAYQAIAERYLRMAEDYESSGSRDQAQSYYLKARSFFLKANVEEKASRMWEKYRHLERRG